MKYKNKNSWFINKNYLGKVILFAGGIFLAGEHVAMLENDNFLNNHVVNFKPLETIEKTPRGKKELRLFFDYLLRLNSIFPSNLVRDHLDKISFPSQIVLFSPQKGCCCFSRSLNPSEFSNLKLKLLNMKNQEFLDFCVKDVFFYTYADVEKKNKAKNLVDFPLSFFISRFFKKEKNKIVFNQENFKVKKNVLGGCFAFGEEIIADVEKKPEETTFFGIPGRPDLDVLRDFRNFINHDWQIILL